MIILNAAVEVRYGSLVIVSLRIVALLDVGLEEIMLLLEIVHVVFEQDALAPIIEETASLGVPYAFASGGRNRNEARKKAMKKQMVFPFCYKRSPSYSNSVPRTHNVQ